MWLDDKEKRILLSLARSSIESAFSEKSVEKVALTPIMEERHPCFVTLMKRGRLRGCIGCLTTDRPLHENVVEYAQLASFSDPRFEKLSAVELPEVKLDITVLGPLEPIQNLAEVVLGKHGLSVRHHGRHGVLLAHVATDYRWTLEQFRNHTCEKAGLNPENQADYDWFRFEEISFSE